MLQRLAKTLAVIAIMIAIALPTAAQTNRHGSLRDLRELSEAIAKVAANEHRTEDERGLWNGPSINETLLIVQVTESHGRRLTTRLNWLRRHSCRVLEHPDHECRKICSRGNCLWARNLTWSDAKPDGWPDPYPWRPEAWERTRRLVLGAVMGRIRARPCIGHPSTWGSRKHDYERAVRLGMIPLSCDTLIPGDALAGNVGFTWLRRSYVRGTGPIPARLAMP